MKNHIFTVKDPTRTVMNLKVDNIKTTVPDPPQELCKNGTACRKEILRKDRPDTIPEPGVKDIKRVELFTKYRPFLPEEFQNKTYPYPGKEVMDLIKAKKNATARERTANKQKNAVGKSK